MRLLCCGENRQELTFEQADAKYALKVGAGRAYVQGYQVGYNQPIYVYGDKPRDVNFNQNSLTQITEHIQESIHLFN